jgi:hypothetical protein
MDDRLKQRLDERLSRLNQRLTDWIRKRTGEKLDERFGEMLGMGESLLEV